MSDSRKTPLHASHVKAGARMVPFAGFDMPVSYTGIIQEHTAVRERVGLFDVSHMGEFVVTGKDTWPWLNSVVTNNVSRLADNGVQYTVMCREDGTAVDDLLVSRLSGERALIVVNAANIEKDYRHMSALLSGNVQLEDHSDRWALIAVQGPQSRELLKRCGTFAPVHDALEGLRYYHLLPFASGGEDLVVSRTGYTGEHGYEVFVPAASAESVWEELMAQGEALGVSPVGLAARDTLRFEASFCLYGHELDDETSPLQAGLRWVVKLKKGDFVGREALAAEKESGSPRRLVGLEIEGRNIARQGFDVLFNGEEAGVITSGTFSPTLQRSLALAYLRSDAVKDSDGDLAVQIRNKMVPAARVDIPFYPSRAAED